MAVAAEQEDVLHVVLGEEVEDVLLFAGVAFPRVLGRVGLPLAARADDLERGFAGEQFALQPGELFCAELGFGAVVGGFVGRAVVAVVEHEKIHVAAGEFEIDAGVVGLARAGVGEELVERAECVFLARLRAVAVVHAEVVIVPDAVERRALKERAEGGVAAVRDEGGALLRGVGGVGVMVVAEQQHEIDARARVEVGPGGGVEPRFLADAGAKGEAQFAPRAVRRRGGESGPRAGQRGLAVEQHGVEIMRGRFQLRDDHDAREA